MIVSPPVGELPSGDAWWRTRPEQRWFGAARSEVDAEFRSHPWIARTGRRINLDAGE